MANSLMGISDDLVLHPHSAHSADGRGRKLFHLFADVDTGQAPWKS